MQRIGRPRVFGQRTVGEIRIPGIGVERDVLEHGAETHRCVVDFRLGLARQIDRLGVAAAFEVEHAVIRPAMFIVADQGSRGVGRQRRLAGAGQAEEDGRVALFADIGRAMHRQHAPRGQKIVHHRENRLLDFARVVRAADQDQLLGEVQHDEHLGTGTVNRGDRLQVRRVQHGEIRLEIVVFFDLRIDEHVLGKKAVPCLLGDHAHLDAVIRIGACVAILHEHFLVLHIGKHAVAHRVEMFRRNLVVDRTPPDVAGVFRLVDDVLVLWRPAGVLAGGDNQPAAGGQFALAAL